MAVTNSIDYDIRQLPSTLISNNRYIFIDSIDGDLQMKCNKWFLNLNYYVIMNSILPLNMLTASITLPFATIDSMSLVRNLYASVPE
jgi:hypothetical protein